MRIRLIIAQYQTRYEGELQPSVVDAWDEYALDDNGVGYNDALTKHQAMVPAEYEWVRELDVIVPDVVIDELATVPVVQVSTRKAV